jgi:TetR/AcrR family transcriptional regulator, transcriptional repressor for nem operon
MFLRMFEMKETKDKITRQALEYFTVNDYQGASLISIAKALGITKGAIYHYFGSKEELFKECMFFLFDTLEDMLNEMISTENEINVGDFIKGFFTIDEQLAIVAERLKIDLLKDYLNYVYLMFLGLKKFPELRTRISVLYAGSRTGMKFQLEEFKKKGMILEDVNCESLAIQILALSEGIMLITAVDQSINLKKTGADIAESIIKSIT